MTLEVPEVNALDPGVYPAKVTNIEVKTTDAGTFRIWSFDVAGEKVTASSSMMFGPKSKTYKWVSAIIGRSPVPGEKLEVVGRACQLVLIVDEDSGYNKVETVLPPNNATQPAPQPAAPAAAPMTVASPSQGMASVGNEMPPLMPLDVDDIPF